MKKIVWRGSFTLTTTAILPEDATPQEVAEQLAMQLNDGLNFCYPVVRWDVRWDTVQNIEEVDVIE